MVLTQPSSFGRVDQGSHGLRVEDVVREESRRSGSIRMLGVPSYIHAPQTGGERGMDVAAQQRSTAGRGAVAG